ncbi:hypothetical protein [Devosia sp. 66-22]|uniref:hypothetical protein n=1 Tax=Devosia sp. 66-22 TaxID=1895753 RepID=UPI0009295418|nr:hypothetical protein [Devosia sp. 66-22]OJX54728.1 MAG: hypothetical protein BGO81_16545 [Devosia sp. 66-22]
MLATTPTTLLEAVNLCLANIGEPPVNSIEDSGVLFAVTALQTLSNVSREVQTRGWHWNEEVDYPIAPTYPEGFVEVPKNTLKVDSSGRDSAIDVVLRGSRLYDRQRRSYVFPRSVLVNLTLLLPFEELPEAARWYIAVRSARRFQASNVGSAELDSFTKLDEAQARVTLEDDQAQVADYNINQTGPVEGTLR